MFEQCSFYVFFMIPGAWCLGCIAFFSLSIISLAKSQELVGTINIEFPHITDSKEHLSNADTTDIQVYFLSGLGADKRIFSKLNLDNRFAVKHIEWIRPLKKESIKHYAGRLAAQIDTTKPFKLVGLSFGGIIASELSDIVRPEQIIIISSTSTGVPVSGFYRGLFKALLFSPFAAPILKSANSMTYKYFGADTPELKSLLKNILHDTDSKLLKWALIQMSSWNRKTKAQNLYHIHGTADRLIPIKLVHPDAVIEGGTHLMVFSKHEKISALLNQQLR